jgi:hypothetical protein
VNVFLASKWIVGTAQKNEVVNPFLAQKDVVAMDAGELPNIRLSINMYEENRNPCPKVPLWASSELHDCHGQLSSMRFSFFSFRHPR